MLVRVQKLRPVPCLTPSSHRWSDASGCSLHRSTSCVCVSLKHGSAHSPLHSHCSPSCQADHCPRNWTQTVEREETMSVTYQNTYFLSKHFVYLLRWGWVEVRSIHPAPVSLVFSLHQSDPIVIFDINYFWNVVLEIQNSSKLFEAFFCSEKA